VTLRRRRANFGCPARPRRSGTADGYTSPIWDVLARPTLRRPSLPKPFWQRVVEVQLAHRPVGPRPRWAHREHQRREDKTAGAQRRRTRHRGGDRPAGRRRRLARQLADNGRHSALTRFSRTPTPGDGRTGRRAGRGAALTRRGIKAKCRLEAGCRLPPVDSCPGAEASRQVLPPGAQGVPRCARRPELRTRRRDHG
jgi:hypothetical protein